MGARLQAGGGVVLFIRPSEAPQKLPETEQAGKKKQAQLFSVGVAVGGMAR